MHGSKKKKNKQKKKKQISATADRTGIKVSWAYLVNTFFTRETEMRGCHTVTLAAASFRDDEKLNATHTFLHTQALQLLPLMLISQVA